MTEAYAGPTIDDYLDKFDDHHEFPGVDTLNEKIAALAADHPGVARLSTIGSSRLGDPMRLLSVGSGARHILLLGAPHPNEPVGLLTIVELARLTATCPELTSGLDCTWHFVPCIDPDGARLNETWYAAPLTIPTYHRHFYRPALAGQPEWAFPHAPGQAPPRLPETRALMHVIDTVRPAVQFPLHNADFGGAYFVLSRPMPELRLPLLDTVARHRIPVETHPTDCSGWPELAEGIFVMPPGNSAIPTTSITGEPRGQGAYLADYADRYRTLTVTIEIPMWAVRAPVPGGLTIREFMRAAADELLSAMAPVEAALARVSGDLSIATPFRDAVLDTLGLAQSAAARWRGREHAPDAHLPVTPGPMAGAQNTTRRFSLRALGMLLRHLDAECAAGNHTPAIRAELGALTPVFEAACERVQADTQARPLPLTDVVRLQAEAILRTAALPA